MKKILFFICLTAILSCSSDNDNQGGLIRDNRISITTWKLISIKNDAEKEIATDCELQNNKIIYKNNPKTDDPWLRETAAFIEGKIKNQECQTITTNNIIWMMSSQLQLYFPNNNTTYFYDFNYFIENNNTYLTLTLTSFDNGIYIGINEERKVYKYILEHKEFLE